MLSKTQFMQIFYIISAARIAIASFAWINYIATFVILEALDALDGLIAWFTKNIHEEKNKLDFAIDLYAQGFYFFLITLIQWPDWFILMITLVAIKAIATISRFKISEKFVIINPPLFKIVGARLIIETLIPTLQPHLLPITIAILVLNPIFEYSWHYGHILNYRH